MTRMGIVLAAVALMTGARRRSNSTRRSKSPPADIKLEREHTRSGSTAVLRAIRQSPAHAMLLTWLPGYNCPNRPFLHGDLRHMVGRQLNPASGHRCGPARM